MLVRRMHARGQRACMPPQLRFQARCAAGRGGGSWPPGKPAVEPQVLLRVPHVVNDAVWDVPLMLCVGYR